MTKMLKKIPANVNGRDFVVGDVHGEYDKLMNGLSRFEFSPDDGDRLFAVGDLIDRGPDSEKMLDLLWEDWFFSVMGNHDFMMLDVCRGDQTYAQSWYHYGGAWTMNYTGVEIAEHQWTTAIHKHMPIAIELETKSGEKVGIVHAQPPRIWQFPEEKWGIDFESEAVQDLLWNDDRIINKEAIHVQGVDWVYCGHYRLPKPTLMGNVWYIDTGCVYGGSLTIKEIV